jgi:hypothetical protein
MGTSVIQRISAEACGPCHPDAACINGCTPGSDRTAGPVKDVSRYTNTEVVLRIAEKLSCSRSTAEEVFGEMKQYLARSAAGAGPSSPTRKVDIAWHEFILFTRDYRDFCREHFGRFVHHVPTPRLVSAPGDAADCSPDTGGGGDECCPDYD